MSDIQRFKENRFYFGQRVLVYGDEIGMVIKSPTGRQPFDVWVRLLATDEEHCYSYDNVKPLPNGEL